tara:strand:+ start:457 stop:813 length:357 start_codon:yes stop_codon:yes gene_type:complete
MKSNIEKVYSKLPQKKHNFKKQKVDLASVQELKNQMTLIKNGNSLAEEVVQKYEEALQEASNFYSEFNRIYEESVDIAFDVLKKSEDLGVEIPEVSEMNTLLDETNEYLLKINEIAKK